MISHYLLFNRNCDEAVRTYEKAFHGKITEMRTYADMPSNPDFPIPEADRNLVLHARLKLFDMEIMCADSSERSISGTNMYVSVTTEDGACVERAWEILKQGGKIYMELTPSFFAKKHGSLQDKFGINWMFTAL